MLLVGHGSLRPDAGAAMLRLAARAHAIGLAGLVRACFLNYSRPSFPEALQGCAESGIGQVVVQPYFLVPGKFVREDLPRLIVDAQRTHPQLAIQLAQPFGDHRALARLLLKRAGQAAPAPPTRAHSALLIMAHGSPSPQANAPIYRVARRVRASGQYEAVTVCFMELNRPSVSAAIDALAARGKSSIVAAPYFLQLGNHVKDDLPALIEQARTRHPSITIALAEHLAYDPLLLDVIADRVAEA